MTNESLSVIVTAQCNLKCSYCYQNARAMRKAEWNIIQAGMDLAAGGNSSQVDMMFLGGEPLLEFDLLRRAVAYGEMLGQRGKRFCFALSTNGTLVSDDVADFLDEHEIVVQLSFDGVRQAQDRRGTGTFEIVDGLLGSLRERHPRLFQNRLRIAMTVLPDSCSSLADSVKYLLEKGVPEIRISPCLNAYPGWEAERIGELDEEFACVADITRVHLEKTGTVPLAILRRSVGKIGSSASARAACAGLTGDALTLDLDGQLYTCSLLAESYQRFVPGSLTEQQQSKLKLGDVGDAEISRRRAALAESARNEAAWASLKNCSSSYGDCNACAYYGQCVICPVSVWQASGVGGPYRVPDFICAIPA